MTDFLHRLVAKALAPSDGAARLLPRTDWDTLPLAVPPESPEPNVQAPDGRAHIPSFAGANHSSGGQGIGAAVLTAELRPALPENAERVEPPQTVARTSESDAPPAERPAPLRVAQGGDRRENDRPVDGSRLSVDTRKTAPRQVTISTAAPGEPLGARDTTTAAAFAGNHPAVRHRRPGTAESTDRRVGATPSRPASLPLPVMPRASIEQVVAEGDRAGLRRSRAALGAQRDAARDEPPAVHVTIGRLEIRAPQPASAPPRSHAPRADTLDEYLSKRAARNGR